MKAGSNGHGAVQNAAVPAWDEPDWLDDATAWVGTYVDLAGPIRPAHSNWWSLIARVPTSGVNPWFKELGAPFAHEPALTAALARHAPRFVPEVIAAEGPRLLTSHVGRRLDRLIGEAGAASPLWEKVVTSYAELQIELIPVATVLPAPDARPQTMAGRFGDVVAPLVRELGDSLPVTLVHLDVSHKNVCLRDGSPILIDWAAGAIGHPFCGLAKTLRVLVRRFGAEDGDSAARRIRDAYLEPWTAFAPPRELRRILQYANALAILCRAATTQELFEHRMTAELTAFEDAMCALGVLGG